MMVAVTQQQTGQNQYKEGKAGIRVQTGKWNKIPTDRINATASYHSGGDIKKPRMSRRSDSATFHKMKGEWFFDIMKTTQD